MKNKINNDASLTNIERHIVDDDHCEWAEEVIELAYEARAISKLIRALCPEKRSVSYEELVAYHDRIVEDYKKEVAYDEDD